MIKNKKPHILKLFKTANTKKRIPNTNDIKAWFFFIGV